MTGSLSEIKVRITSTQKTGKITSAMKMVSSAKLVKSEQAAKDFQIYASKIRQITTDLLHSDLRKGSAIRCLFHVQLRRRLILSLLLIKAWLVPTIQPS